MYANAMQNENEDSTSQSLQQEWMTTLLSITHWPFDEECKKVLKNNHKNTLIESNKKKWCSNTLIHNKIFVVLNTRKQCSDYIFLQSRSKSITKTEYQPPMLKPK